MKHYITELSNSSEIAFPGNKFHQTGTVILKTLIVSIMKTKLGTHYLRT